MSTRLCVISTLLPDLFRRVTENVVQGVPASLDLHTDLDHLAEMYDDWALTWAHSDAYQRIYANPPELAMLALATICRYLGYYAMCNRLLVVSAATHRGEAERRATRAAKELLACSSRSASLSVPGLGIVLARKVARSILVTSGDWLTSDTVIPAADTAASFRKWCDMLDRKT
jgi:hypothetical protein